MKGLLFFGMRREDQDDEGDSQDSEREGKIATIGDTGGGQVVAIS